VKLPCKSCLAALKQLDEAKTLCVYGEAISQACLKAKALSGGTKMASAGETKAYYKAKVLSSGAKIASIGEASASQALGEAISQFSHKRKALSGGTKAALPSEVNTHDEAKLASPKAKQIALKAKSKAPKAKQVVLQSPRVPVLDRLSPMNSNLRDYLSNKRKLHSEKPVNIFPS